MLKFAAYFFHRIFGRTLSLILENIENYLLVCNDIVGLLIMIKVSSVDVKCKLLLNCHKV